MANAMTGEASVSFPAFSGVMATDGSRPALILRWALALVMFPHGAQKLLGWWGGYGLNGTLDFFVQSMGLPLGLAWLVVLIEFFAPLALALGLLTRPAALGIGAIMVGAVATVHWPHGFFMNWAGNQAGEGFEYHLLVLAIAAALVWTGGGKYSLDRRWATELEG